MRLPNQAKPVKRTMKTSSEYNGNGITPAGCSVWDWIKCAGIVAGCVAACCAGTCIGSPTCIACLGSAYGNCKDCF